MSPNFEKLCKFDIDCDRLYNEWSQTAKISHTVNMSYVRLAVNHSGEGTGANRTKFVSGQSTDNDLKLFTADDLVEEFKHSYTKEVIAMVEQWLNQRGLRSTRIKYAALIPNGVIGLHVDKDYDYRYHLTVQVNEGCTMTVGSTTHSIAEPATLFRMYAKELHGADNRGSTTRLLLTFDVTTN